VHAKYKIPGGKLVAVDLDVTDGTLSDVHIFGDFFLEPDDALERINAALTGAPVETGVRELAARIERGLDPSDALIGFTPRDVAIVVRRALGKSTTWDDHRFELIVDGPRTPAMHMALDQVLAEGLAAGTRGPTLRIWHWASNAVILGSFQSVRNEVDLEAAARHDVTVVRRITGGGAMFVEPGNTITYSLVAPGSLVDGLSYEESYAFLDAWVLAALNDLGIAATYQPINDITSPAGKIAGAAQRRLTDGTVLHHVTMAYDIDTNKMLEVLRIGREKLSDKGTKSAAKRVDPLRSQTGMSREAIIDAFLDTFRSRHTLTDSAPTADEIAKAEELVRTKFSTPEWTNRVP
jgi:lipoate-protein ligase A